MPAGIPNFCRQCSDFPCMDACKQDAMSKHDGVLTIDQRKCDGCGDCIRQCPYNALYRLENDKATKCDLCYPDFSPKCVEVCGRLALVLKDSEIQTSEWNISQFNPAQAKEIIAHTKNGVIFLDKDDTLRYADTQLRNLSEDESVILTDCIELFKEMARESLIDLPLVHKNFEQAREKIKHQCSSILTDYLHRHSHKLDDERTSNLIEIFTATVGGNLGPLDFLIYDDSFEEITFNGMGSNISVKHRKFGRMETNLFFNDSEYVKENIINKIAGFVGEPNISESNPILPATLPNKDRLHALMYPVVKDIAFTIRHFPSAPLTLPQLISNGTLDSEAASYLWLMMELGRTIFLVGATGTGKTTFLNTLLPLIPPERRILILEEVQEINVPHSNTLRHQTRRSQGILLADLIHSSLRETPDRLVIGEIRTPDEINAFLEVAQAGPGEATYTTFHGETLETALKRLEHHGISSADLPGAVHLLVLLKRHRASDEKHHNADKRYVAEIAELKPDATLNKIFVYDQKSHKLKKQSDSILLKEYTDTFSISKSELNALLETRTRLLKQSSDLTQSEFFKQASKALKGGET